jgi:penicillin-binding protein 1C
VSAVRRWAVRAVVATAVAAAVLLAVRLAPRPRLAATIASSTAVYDARGRLLKLTLASDEQYRLWRPLEEVSPQFVAALLLKEDRWYRWHPGVNPVALVRAARETYGGGARQGASTITMQFARLYYRLDTRTVPGKFEQIALALWLEARYSKREILEAHVNLLPYGGNVQGMPAASLIYFGRDARDLTLSEALALAVIPQAPRTRDPGGGENASLAAARTRLLDDWCRAHPESAAEARLVGAKLAYRPPERLPNLAPHLTTTLVAQAPGAREIRTTLDLELQALVERRIAHYVEARRETGIRNAVALLVDTRTGSVRALVGSADWADPEIQGQVNGVYAKRSPGSALKPFIYALAVDQGLIHPRTVLKDAPSAFGAYSPENFDGAFVGPIPAEDALIGSRNVPAVLLASKLSDPSLYQFLKTAGVANMASERHYGLALALGGGEVTMEELATLYLALANGGQLTPLRYLAGEERAAPAGPTVLSPEASFIVLDMLAHNPRPGFATLPDGPPGAVAWKTGTSWGFRDAWTVGVFDSFVLAVWVGNFDGHGDPALVGVRAAAPLFFEIADAVRAARPTPRAPGFLPPRGVARVDVCAASGDLPNADCPRTVPTWYVPGRSPIRVSTLHRRLRVDRRTGRLACPDAAPGDVREEVFEVWPSDVYALYAQAGMPRRRPPPAGACAAAEGVPGTPPEITFPRAGVAYQIRAAALGRQTIPLVASADGAAGTVYWFVDARFVGAARPSQPVEWVPDRPGEFALTAVDDRGGSSVRTLRVGLVP